MPTRACLHPATYRRWNLFRHLLACYYGFYRLRATYLLPTNLRHVYAARYLSPLCADLRAYARERPVA